MFWLSSSDTRCQRFAKRLCPNVNAPIPTPWLFAIMHEATCETFSMSTSEVHHPNTPPMALRLIINQPKRIETSPMPNGLQTDQQPHPRTPGLHRCPVTLKLILNPTPNTFRLHRCQTTIRPIINPTRIHLGFTDAN